ncbi:MAG: TonB-dependent receptor [Brevundimonas sp.]|uniref:TonB-dependent receptor plug domain-containing protein n=1 Tax=Brevundimonas sp. TaxID=1871086 RepID=UPI0018077936|nr:TonB-dependent receptor [Brevundimonas sp.]MBA4804902.1 TonB-dependent receptor [Brevundimonas sp.]
MLLTVGASVAALGTHAYAQTPPPASGPQEQDAATLDEVVVVGSQIRGARVNDALPVTVLEAEDLDGVAATNGDELFRAIPQAADVAFNESQDVGGINDARGDTASINLRGLGTGNTLMLLNGRRMVLHPGTQTENLVPVTTVNTNAIPNLGVRRVEVLLDGAAALYGTDAVAGVINTVLRSNFEGFTFEAGAGTAEGTDFAQYDFSLQAGRDFNGGRTNLSLMADYATRNELWAREREYARHSDNRPLLVGTPFEGDTDFQNTSLDTPWGEFIRLTNSYNTSTALTRVNGQTLTTSGVFHVQPNYNEGCVAPGIVAGTCFDNSSLSSASTDNNLRYNINDVRALTGANDRLNVFLFANHEFDNGLEFFGEAGVYFADYNTQREQETPLTAARIIMPANAYWNPLGPVGSPNRLPGLTSGAGNSPFPADGAPLALQDYRVVDAGPQYVNVESLSTRFLAGLRGEWRGFDWESAVLYSTSRTDDTMRAISSTLFQQAIARTTPDAYNPFIGGSLIDPSRGPEVGNPQSVIDSFMVDVSRISETSLAMWDMKLSRPDLFYMPAGPVGMALGIEARHETFEDDRDDRLDGTITFTNLAGESTGSDVMGASPTPDTEGDRDVLGAFVEFAVPLVSPDMNVPLVHSLDLQVAGRAENYSVFGSVAKPKVALAWRPASWMMLRSAWSQGFRAPNLPQLYEEGVERANTRSDWARCDIEVRAGRVPDFDSCSVGVSSVSQRSGSTELKPEESENFTAGLVVEPRFLPQGWGELTFTVDYWNVRQENLIGIFGDANALTLDYLLRARGSSNPNVVRAAPTQEQVDAAAGTGLAPVGTLQYVIDHYRNLQPREVDGVDFGIYYDLDDTPWGDFSWRLNAAKLLTFYQEPSEDAAELLAAQAAGEIDPSIRIVGAEDLRLQNGLPEWRATSTVTWRNGAWGAGLYSSYVSEVYDTSATLPDGTQWVVDDWLTHNVYLQYEFDGEGPFNDTRLRIGVRNIEGKDPPLADQSFGYMGSLHSNRGRWFYATLRKRF